LFSTNCISDASNPTGTTSSPLYNTCGQILVDVNGPNKGPAQFGRDLFVFYLTKKGIYPRGAYLDMGPSDCSTDGIACASKVILEGAMNY